MAIKPMMPKSDIVREKTAYCPRCRKPAEKSNGTLLCGNCGFIASSKNPVFQEKDILFSGTVKSTTFQFETHPKGRGANNGD